MTALASSVATVAADARERSDAIEQARALPPDLAHQLAASGVLRCLVPRAHGGLEVHPHEFVDALITLGQADAATGWCAMVAATTGMLAASLPEHHADAIYGQDPLALTCGVTAPMGRAQRDGDSWRVSGRWPFASAAANADWIIGGCLVQDPDATDSGEPPAIKLMFFPREAVTLHDNWHVAGLCGTGSGDMEVSDVRVPLDRCVTLGAPARVDRPLYRFPQFGLLALGVASVAVGIGLRALEETVALAGGRIPTGGRRSMAEKAAVQADVGRADAALQSARAWMEVSVERAWAAADRGESLSRTLRSDLRAAAAHATWAAADAVDRLYHAGGGSAIYTRSPLQRCFRDVHVATQHVMVNQAIFEMTGRVRLGLPAAGLL